MPDGTFGMIVQRMSLFWNHMIEVTGPIIDYTPSGVINLIVTNNSDSDFTINKGQSIAHFIPCLTSDAKMVEFTLDNDVETTSEESLTNSKN